VRTAEEIIYNKNYTHEYLSQDGLASFNEASRNLLFGADHQILNENRVYSIQAISGTGSLRLALDFIKQEFPNTTVYIPSVTWGNHPAMVDAVGLKQAQYSYLDKFGTGLDFESMLSDISAAPEGAVILLHAIAHNPTGVDPTNEEWDRLCVVMKEKKHLPFFDNAYQGFISGDPNTDAYAVRSFAAAGMEMIVCCSFAKNFCLYGERVGCVHTVVSDVSFVDNVGSQMRSLSRVLWSTCPAWGARVVSTVLNDASLNAAWLKDVRVMADRIADIRVALHAKLNEMNIKSSTGTWDHIKKQRGMFSFTGLSKEAVLKLKDRHIYMLSSGRVSMPGLNHSNLQYFCNALKEVLGTNETE
jgi:aspartate aminotransferase, cytoplasmic